MPASFVIGGNMKKSLVNRLCAFILSFVVLIGSCIVSVLPVHAAALPEIPALVNYILTAVGAVNIADSVVGKVSGQNLLTALSDVVQACLNDGSIYISASGDYVFNSESTAAIYETLLSDDNIDAKVISNFPNWRTYNDLGWNNLYINSDFIEYVNNFILLNDVSLLCFMQQVGSNVITACYIYDVDDYSYFLMDRVGSEVKLIPYNNNGRVSNVTANVVWSNFSGSSGTFNVSTFTDESNAIRTTLYDRSNVLESTFLSFPVSSFEYRSSVYPAFCYCNRSIVVCSNVTAGSLLYNKNSEIIYNNYYDIIPSVSETVINENNWENIYNSYVTNVNNEYQQIYESNGNVTADEIREILKDIGDRIDDIISDAGGEIIENLDDILTWLSRIYDRLDEIRLATGDNADVLAALDSLSETLNGVKADTVYLARVYALLGDILDKMGDGGSGRGYPDIVNKLPDVDNTNIMNYISTGQVIASTLQTVIPFAFVPMMQGLLHSLSAEPVTPRWEIPFTLQNQFVNVDDVVIIDFGQFEILRQIFNSLIMIGFIIWLIWFTFYLTDIIGNMLF